MKIHFSLLKTHRKDMEYAPSKKDSGQDKISANDCMIIIRIRSHIWSCNINPVSTRRCWAPDRHSCQWHGVSAGIRLKGKHLRWNGWWLQGLPFRPSVGRWCDLPPHSWIQPHLLRPSVRRWCLGLAPTKQVETSNVTTSSVWTLKRSKRLHAKIPKIVTYSLHALRWGTRPFSV